MNKIAKQSKFQNKTVLIIEDDLFISGMYADKLVSEGFQVYSAADGGNGLRLARESRPDLILLDIILPVVDGFEVLRQLKQDKERAATPVIILTNISDPELIKTGLSLGAADYLVKAHFVPSEVMAHIKALLK